MGNAGDHFTEGRQVFGPVELLLELKAFGCPFLDYVFASLDDERHHDEQDQP